MIMIMSKKREKSEKSGKKWKKSEKVTMKNNE